MPLESATYINGLDANNPTGSDSKAVGDDLSATIVVMDAEQEAEASLYTRDQAGMAMFESAFQQALADANREENTATELRVDVGVNNGAYNIYKDG